MCQRPHSRGVGAGIIRRYRPLAFISHLSRNRGSRNRYISLTSITNPPVATQQANSETPIIYPVLLPVSRPHGFRMQGRSAMRFPIGNRRYGPGNGEQAKRYDHRCLYRRGAESIDVVHRPVSNT